MVKPADAPALRVRLALADVEPPVWRELVLPGSWHLGKVHWAIQSAMGWEDSHLHKFQAGDRRFGPRDPFGGGEDVAREEVFRLHEVLVQVGDLLDYTYDFGDDWRHQLTVLELLAPTALATCLDGAGACPPEDCGGPWGYEQLLTILADPQHPEHEDRLEWIGGPVDPASFDVEVVAQRLGRIR